MVTGCDGAFIGYNENKYAILEDDGLGLSLYILEEDAEAKTLQKTSKDSEKNSVLDENSFSESNVTNKSRESLQQGPIQFVFYSPVQRIFSTPLG